MKKIKFNKYILLLFSAVFLMLSSNSSAQEKSAPVPVLKLRYFNNSNSNVQYLLLESMLKENKVLTPQANKAFQLYLNNTNPESLVANLLTDKSGKAKAFIPPSLKAAWDGLDQNTFIVKEGDEEVISDYVISKSRMTLDTASTDGVRSLTMTVMTLVNDEWLPAPDVEAKIGILRSGNSILSAGTEETYTTDSSGMVTVELTKDSLPGDFKGNYVLAARVDDNDLFGNLMVQKTVPWGLVTKADTGFFNQRTLWSTRLRTPIWLLLMAYSIIIGVWGTLIYLVIQLFKIKKLAGLETEESPSEESGNSKNILNKKSAPVKNVIET